MHINNVSWCCFVVRVRGKFRTFAANFQICNFMIYFFRTPAQSVIATQVNHELSAFGRKAHGDAVRTQMDTLRRGGLF